VQKATSPNVMRFACRECPAQRFCFGIPGTNSAWRRSCNIDHRYHEHPNAKMSRGRDASKEDCDLERRNDDKDLHGDGRGGSLSIRVVSTSSYNHEEAASQRGEPMTLFWYTSDMK